LRSWGPWEVGAPQNPAPSGTSTSQRGCVSVRAGGSRWQSPACSITVIDSITSVGHQRALTASHSPACIDSITSVGHQRAASRSLTNSAATVRLAFEGRGEVPCGDTLPCIGRVKQTWLWIDPATWQNMLLIRPKGQGHGLCGT